MRKNLNIKFICTGNTCRSPMAEGIFRLMCRGVLPHAVISSAGLYAAEGSPACANAVSACAEKGVDISAHRSSQLKESDINLTDYFFVMTPEHARKLLLFGVPAEKIYVPRTVDDPYGGDIEVYRTARDKITVECERFLSLLSREHMRIEPLTEKTLPYALLAEKVCFSHPWSEEGIKNRLSDENTDFFIAIAGETPLGYIGMETAADEGYIFNAAVLPEYRRHGVGEALVKKLIEVCLNKKLRLLTLEVRCGNAAAISLYEKCGFKKVGERKNYYSSPVENALLMTKFFCAEQ